jgi:hypothetical protein
MVAPHSGNRRDPRLSGSRLRRRRVWIHDASCQGVFRSPAYVTVVQRCTYFLQMRISKLIVPILQIGRVAKAWAILSFSMDVLVCISSEQTEEDW